MVTFSELEEETNKYKDTLVLDFFEVKLFRRVTEDPDDYYYEYFGWRETEPTWCSAVGWFIPLIDRLDKDQYNYLVSVWNLNNENKAREIE